MQQRTKPSPYQLQEAESCVITRVSIEAGLPRWSLQLGLRPWLQLAERLWQRHPSDLHLDF